MTTDDLLNYIEVDGKPVKETDDVKWLEAFHRDRVVKKTDIGVLRVSTVFLACDHSWGLGGDPQLYETMVFSGGELEDDMLTRYATREEAAEGHEIIVAKVKNLLKENENDKG